MSTDEKFDAPDADIILRALGPPSRDFRLHKLVLSLASPVFKDMFSLPQPAPDGSRTPSVAGVEIIEVIDSPDALDTVLRLIYPFTPPPSVRDLDALVDCLVIADKYEIKAARLRLGGFLAQTDASQSLRVYAIASRFGFNGIAQSISQHALSAVHLPGILQLPDDFKYVSAAAYHRLVRQRAIYLEAVVELIKKTPLKSKCCNCPGGKYFSEDVFRSRLVHLIMVGTPLEAKACSEAWVKEYGNSPECQEDCVLKFIRFAVSKVDKGLVIPAVSPPQRGGILKKA